MISLESIKGFFPEALQTQQFTRHLLKEYIECLSLEWISGSMWASKLSFIGGTNLRLVKDIDRFSEDLDFDCKGMSQEEFISFTDGLVAFLKNNGLPVATKEKESARLTAFRRSIAFPGLLHNLGLSAFKEERFMMKVEVQDQGIEYNRESALIKRCGFFFSVPVPPEGVLCAMKLSALLTRAKGRDFYDTIFLLQRTAPDYRFLSAKHPGIDNLEALKQALFAKLHSVNLESKRRDVEHLLFRHERADVILHFTDFISAL